MTEKLFLFHCGSKTTYSTVQLLMGGRTVVPFTDMKCRLRYNENTFFLIFSFYLLCTSACDSLLHDFGSLDSNMTRASAANRDKVTEAVEVKVTQMEQEEDRGESGNREHLGQRHFFFFMI